MKIRLVELREIPVPCLARRGPRGKVECEKPALHAAGCITSGYAMHSGRGVRGQWFFW